MRVTFPSGPVLVLSERELPSPPVQLSRVVPRALLPVRLLLAAGPFLPVRLLFAAVSAGSLRSCARALRARVTFPSGPALAGSTASPSPPFMGLRGTSLSFLFPPQSIVHLHHSIIHLHHSIIQLAQRAAQSIIHHSSFLYIHCYVIGILLGDYWVIIG